ncbi:hypothetical protein KIN20_032295 [Parelaphostrongylus tenuis]|uniref:Threonyl-tRNA synthetase n=1 Tax=Parelaphostrongylus tenuis TaxID=148309 RepID=A0AAD5WHM3_PARTN|nr:hypothetical protein KIN20_032295 [Parelaphostrongylus tenuis]
MGTSWSISELSGEMTRVAAERNKMLTANCSGHCLFYGHWSLSHADLPIRYSDYGLINRNSEKRDPLSLPYRYDLDADDSHIFCLPDQISQEVKETLAFVSSFYDRILNFKIELELATGPMVVENEGSENWKDIEDGLKVVLEEYSDVKVNIGAAPHYGPRINIIMQDSEGQIRLQGWIQLDFELPERFNLNYSSEDGRLLRPVLVHRALIAPIEEILSIISAKNTDLWPFWLSPQQVAVLPIGPPSIAYARKVAKELRGANLETKSDFDCLESFNKRVKIAVDQKYAFILVVGKAESKHGTVNVRTRTNKVLGEFLLDDVVREFRRFVDGYYNDTQCFEAFEKLPKYQVTPHSEP